MFKKIPIPPSFSLIQKGKVFLLLKEEYKDFLLQQGIEDLKAFLKKHLQDTRYLKTPFWNFYFADDAPEKKEIIRTFFDKIRHGEYEMFVSKDWNGSRLWKCLMKNYVSL